MFFYVFVFFCCSVVLLFYCSMGSLFTFKITDCFLRIVFDWAYAVSQTTL